jgi:hypothetical protein
MTHARTQRDRLLDLLKAGRGDWIPLPETLALGIAQYSARIHELRKLGYGIENRKERDGDVLHTYFRLSGTNGASVIVKLKQENSTEPGSMEQAGEWVARALAPPKEPVSGSLFGDAPERHRDDG